MIERILNRWIRHKVDNSVYEFEIQQPSIMIGEFLCSGETTPFADNEIWLSWGCLNIPFINKEINYDKLYDHIEKTIQPEGDEALREISRPISNKKDILFTFGEDATPAIIINYIEKEGLEEIYQDSIDGFKRRITRQVNKIIRRWFDNQ